MKKWYTSKTIWLNILTGLLGILSLVDAQFLSELGVTNTTVVIKVLFLSSAFLNLMLRVISSGNVIETKKRIKRAPLTKGAK